jgi:hypothetical protein
MSMFKNTVPDFFPAFLDGVSWNFSALEILFNQ